MYREFFRHSTVLSLPMISMALFIATFIGVVVFAVRRRAKPEFDHMAAMPLEDGEEAST